YNVDSKKGMISIDGTKYDFTSYTHTINEPDYTLKAGTDLTVMVTGTKMHEYEDPEPGILKGKAAKVVITLKGAALELTDVDVVDGTNAD
ncbi:MAG TPA: hypothetical protein VKH37_03765, partial [Ferruginibacter sp.]|nr:hypothetical protein [Ferruginibacter sp.]